jgi:hypothetical protein
MPRAIVTMTPRLSPEETAKVARRLLDVVEKPISLFQSAPLAGPARAIGELAGRLEADQRGALTTAAAHKLLALMEATKGPSHDWVNYSDALLVLAPHLPTAEAAPTARKLLDFLEEPNHVNTVSSLVLAAGLLADRLSPEEAAASAGKLLDFMSRGPDSKQHRGFCTRALPGLLRRATDRDLIDLFKQPTCVREGRQRVLAELGHRLGALAPEAIPDAMAVLGAAPASPISAAVWMLQGEADHPAGRRPFTDRWDAVSWLSRQYPELQASSPLRRPAR